MRLFSGKAPNAVTFKIERPKEGAPIEVTIDGVRFLITDADLSQTLALGKTVEIIRLD
jgi:hypothetical protein